MVLNIGPSPVRYIALAVAVGYAYDQFVTDQGAWDPSDYLIVLIVSWFVNSRVL
jgi:hypothetical protein